jgi:PAS domain S-box-containing protein
MRDVTRRNRTERNARLSQMQYKNIFNAAADGLVIMNFGDIIADANPQMCKLFGYSQEEFLQLHGRDLSPSTEEHAFIKIREAIQSTGRLHLETIGLRKDGSIFDMEVQGTKFVDHSKQQMLGVFRDITQRKENERALKSREQQLLVQAQHLQDANAALKVLLQHRDDDRKELEELLLTNFKALVLPHLESIKGTSLTDRQKNFLEMLEINLQKIVTPFLKNLKAKLYNLTPAEIKVVDLIKEGKRTKEIADMLGLSKRTIDFYRYNIRKKLKLDEKTPLNRYLLTLQ